MTSPTSPLWQTDPKLPTRWIQAAQKGRHDELHDSWGTGFWAEYRAKKSGLSAIHQLLAQGDDASLLPRLVEEGVSLTDPAPDGTPLLQRLVLRSPETTRTWMEALRPYITDWEARKAGGLTLIQEGLRHGHTVLVTTLLDWGVQPPAKPCAWILPMRLKVAPSSIEAIHGALVQHGIRPDHSCTPKDFYASLISAGVPVERLPWYEAHQMYLPASPIVWAACADNARNNGAGWVEELVARGLDPDGLYHGSPLRESLLRQWSSPDYRAVINAWIDPAIAAGIGRRLSALIPEAQEASRPRHRL